MILPVYERVLSICGEGIHAGRKALVVRTYGCPLKCAWCDCAGTWHPIFVPHPAVQRIAFEDIVAEAVAAQPDFVLFTGGEPMMHEELPSLARMLNKEGISSHIETSGAFMQEPETFAWISMSPKREKLPDKDTLREAHEIKLVIDAPHLVKDWCATLEEIMGGFDTDVPVWLFPEWSQRFDRDIQHEVVRAVLERGAPFRAGVQMHKLLKADQLDPRFRSPVPLGGNIERGY